MEGREGKGRRVPHLDLNPGDATDVGLWQANFPCPTLDLQVTADG